MKVKRKAVIAQVILFQMGVIITLNPENSCHSENLENLWNTFLISNPLPVFSYSSWYVVQSVRT